MFRISLPETSNLVASLSEASLGIVDSKAKTTSPPSDTGARSLHGAGAYLNRDASHRRYHLKEIHKN